uniref:Uncharacterized protein n=1 Tax=Anguilla anguilla TaxID=7936 RepID=A0A0E9P8X9_ANGAN
MLGPVTSLTLEGTASSFPQIQWENTPLGVPSSHTRWLRPVVEEKTAPFIIL